MTSSDAKRPRRDAGGIFAEAGRPHEPRAERSRERHSERPGEYSIRPAVAGDDGERRSFRTSSSSREVPSWLSPEAHVVEALTFPAYHEEESRPHAPAPARSSASERSRAPERATARPRHSGPASPTSERALRAYGEQARYSSRAPAPIAEVPGTRSSASERARASTSGGHATSDHLVASNPYVPHQASLAPPALPTIDVPPQSTDLDEQAHRFFKAAAELAVAKRRAVLDAEKELIDFAVAIAEVILEENVHRDPRLHRQLARAAMRELGTADPIRLRVSEDAFRELAQAFGGEHFEHDGVPVELVVDRSLQGLGCVAESGASRVDGTLTHRLEALRRTLLEDYEHHAHAIDPDEGDQKPW